MHVVTSTTKALKLSNIPINDGTYMSWPIWQLYQVQKANTLKPDQR